MMDDWETDYLSATGWIVHTFGYRFESPKTTIQLAFEDFISTVRPAEVGCVVRFVPYGLEETDETTVYGSTETLINAMQASQFIQ